MGTRKRSRAPATSGARTTHAASPSRLVAVSLGSERVLTFAMPSFASRSIALVQHAQALHVLAVALVFGGCSQTSKSDPSVAAATAESEISVKQGPAANASVAQPVARAKPASSRAPDAAVKPSIKIVDRLIEFDDERKALTIEYRRIHQDPKSDSVEIEPKLIVLHYTAGGSGDSTVRYFNKTTMSGNRAKLAKAGRVNVSAHFLVERDGTVFRLVPETWMARHTIGLNHLALGVENVGDGDKFPLTAAQVEANASLVRYLAASYPITHLIGHDESLAMEGHTYWLELDPKYRNRKSDPGAEFMAKVRAKVSDLKLEGPP